MALRLIESTFSSRDREAVLLVMKNFEKYPCWYQNGLSADEMMLKVLLPAEETESLMDLFEKSLGGSDRFSLVLLPVQAAIPRLEEEHKEKETKKRTESEERLTRVCREELYGAVMDGTRMTPVFFVMAVLSSVVASIGLLKANLAVIIGAMVIAPLLAPNVALALAATLGDKKLAFRSVRMNLAGFLTAFAVAVGIGLVLSVNPENPEIASRALVDLDDIVLAFVSGCAGALAFTTGVSATMIGVMVAVSLLPPLAACGLLLGAGHSQQALGAFMLLAANIICVNLSGVLTFLFQGVRPLGWREAGRAKKTTFIAAALWAALLAALIAIILISKRIQI